MLDCFSPPTPKSADRANKDNVREFNDLKYRGTSSSLLSVVAGGVGGGDGGGGGGGGSGTSCDLTLKQCIVLLLMMVLFVAVTRTMAVVWH